MSTREITYYDVSPYAALSAAAQTNSAQLQNFSDPQKLFAENVLYRCIQTCEQNYTILDGAHSGFAPDENIGLWSKWQSAQGSRTFPENITLDVSFGGLQTGPGVAFYFDAKNNLWCDMLRVRWYNDGALLSDKMFYPDSPVYSCQNHVDRYNRVIIDFMRVNKPGRYLRVETVLFGIVRVFGDGELERLTVNEGRDPANRTLFINSAGFTFNTKDPVPYIFMRRQPLHIRYNGAYMGAYYIDKSKKYADRRYSVEAVDKIGVLDASGDFMGGMYENFRVEELLSDITGRIFDLEIDGSLRNKTITGWLPVMKRRGALAQVAMAIGAMIDTSRSRYICVKPLPAADTIKHILGKNRVYQSGTVEIEFPCTGIELIEHHFTPGTETRELFKDAFTGEKTVKFSEPVSNLTIENGTIIKSHVNYAVIEGSGATCTLKGRPYIDSQSSVVINAGDLIEGTQEKIEKIEDCWLINKDNSQAAAQRLYEYYLRRTVYDSDFILNADAGETAERIGDTVKAATIFEDDFITGQIERLTLDFGSKNIKARGIIRSD